MDQTTIKQLEKLIQNLLDKAMINVATKDDLKQLKDDLIEEIKDSEAFIVGSADKNKAEKSIVEDLQRRVIKIERKIAA